MLLLLIRYTTEFCGVCNATWTNIRHNGNTLRTRIHLNVGRFCEFIAELSLPSNVFYTLNVAWPTHSLSSYTSLLFPSIDNFSVFETPPPLSLPMVFIRKKPVEDILINMKRYKSRKEAAAVVGWSSLNYCPLECSSCHSVFFFSFLNK